jgi:hypothetical protein
MHATHIPQLAPPYYYQHTRAHTHGQTAGTCEVDILSVEIQQRRVIVRRDVGLIHVCSPVNVTWVHIPIIGWSAMSNARQQRSRIIPSFTSTPNTHGINIYVRRDVQKHADYNIMVNARSSTHSTSSPQSSIIWSRVFRSKYRNSSVPFNPSRLELDAGLPRCA